MSYRSLEQLPMWTSNRARLRYATHCTVALKHAALLLGLREVQRGR